MTDTPGRGPEFTAAERAVLGTIITSRHHAEIVTGILDRDDCFGDPAHQAVYAAVRWLTDEGGAVDVPSVLARLVAVERGVWRTGQAGVILAGLMEHATPSYVVHARKVQAGARTRATAAALTSSMQMIMTPGFDPDTGGDMIRQLIDQAVTGQAAEPLKSQAEILTDVLDELQRGVTPGVPTGFADLDDAIGSLRPGTLTIIAARPAVGKTALASCIADHIASRCGLPVLFSSLEMSPAELMHRRIAATAKVSMDALTKHKLTERDWDQINAAHDRLASSPLIVDGKEGASLAHIRARLRGLTRGDNPVQAAVIDQVGLMDAGRAENRQVAVAGLSRGVKNLAREFNIPVLLLVQINRGPEQRTDKVPMMSDLRESGCMPASTRLLRADNGEEITLGELVLSQVQPMVVAVDSRQRLVPSRLTRAFPSGIKPVYRLRLASGRTVDATANHKFLTIGGWSRLDALAKGSFVAVPRLTSEPQAAQRMNEDELILMAHLLGDGSIGPGFRYTTIDPANRAAVEEAAWRLFEIRADSKVRGRKREMWFPSPYRLTHKRRHPMSNWLEPYGLVGSRSGTKFIPEPIFGLADDQLALFLRHLWATDGSITMLRNGRGQLITIYYATTSRRLADNVQRALLRFGVRARISPSRKTGYVDCWNVVVQGAPNQKKFLTAIGCHGARGEVIPEALGVIERITPNPNVDLVPWPVIGKVREALSRAGISHRELAVALGERYCGSYLLGNETRPRRFARGRLGRIAEITGSSELADIARSDLFWDEVMEITPLGLMPTFDATVEGTHNFVANGVVAHNSLEADADIVLLLHREDYYERESPRAGEVDVIVAKNRQGPQTTVTLAFQGHYGRMVDLAKPWTPSAAADARGAA